MSYHHSYFKFLHFKPSTPEFVVMPAMRLSSINSLPPPLRPAILDAIYIPVYVIRNVELLFSTTLLMIILKCLIQVPPRTGSSHP